MKIEKCIKESFVVIGKEGSTADGSGFIDQLWQEANEHVEEIRHLAKKDEQGNLLGIWGAMSDMSHSFKPWENEFTKGLYLAGIECEAEAQAPLGWTRWQVPGYEYLYVQCDGMETFPKVIQYLKENQIPLVGTVHDFRCPETGSYYMFFPIRRL